jgi:hypothetical protein
MPLGLPIICSFRSFSFQRLHILKWNLVYRFIIWIHVYMYLGQFLFWVRSSNNLQSYDPWISKSSNNLQFPFISCAEIPRTEMKFGIQIYHKNIYIKFCFGYDWAIFDSYATWTSKNSNNLQFPFIFFEEVAHILKWSLVSRFIII